MIRAAIRGALLALLIAGCDSLGSPPVSSECTAIGAKCQLPDGPIGVCQRIECAGYDPGPCYRCTPQH